MSTRDKLLAAKAQLCSAFIGRDEAIDCILLALVTGANFILVGEPGTAKSALVSRAFSHVEGTRMFEKLCGSFATMDEMVGPTDIKAFQSGDWKRVTKGRLADCEFAFLDEVMKSNDGTLNSLLGILNERKYEGAKVPLWCAGAATNWPEVKGRSEAVAALWDRFLLRCRVDCIEDIAMREKMIAAVEAVRTYAPVERVTLEELMAAREEVRAVKLRSAMVTALVGVAKRLGDEKIVISDRRLGALVLVMQAAAWLDGRAEVELDDIDALRFGLWNDAPHIPVAKALLDTVDEGAKKAALKVLAEAQAHYAREVKQEDSVAVARTSTNAAKAANKIMAEQAMRLSTRRLVTAELGKLKNSFEQLANKVQPHFGGDKKKAKKEAKPEVNDSDPPF